MPKSTKRKSQSLSARASASSSKIRKEDEEEDIEYSEEELEEVELDTMSVLEKEDDEDEEFIPDTQDISFKEKIDISTIADLFELCKNQSGSRNLSVLIYTLLRHLNLR
ncbi:unnamed protein product [Didymodactylos carnosus]|uniref:Uncharacterized protein n=1 Tax=Didymodactylos carnosus TaxID=1234261 RepID=A0A814GDZ5_9BILA|nr:unnamed protein product [Didymodactylos carnosus]CAF1180944.1 unnamed protein product [Didymodactylos carnosus]CAF3766529.1 unnamed protein product [Didymodactylos carnosus]CAF3992158.1 unnamed protein product [Didymodactylos carnosus]